MKRKEEEFLRDRISQLRIENNISEYELSLRLGKCKTYLQAITSGKSLPSFSAFFDICEYFEITPSEFFACRKNDGPEMRRVQQKIEQISKEDLELLDRLLAKFDTHEETPRTK